MIYVLFVVVTFLVLCIAFYQWQHFMVFSPTYYREDTLDERYEHLSVTTDDNVRLEGVVYEADDPKKTLLYFGGRSQDSVGLIRRLSNVFPNVRIITFNYRSYGKSEGSVSEKNILKDAIKIADIVQKNYGDFYILGFSLGSNVAAYVAKEDRGVGVFLVGAFDSVASLAKERFVTRGYFPMMDLSSVFRYKFNTKKYVQEIDQDIYLFVSKHDEITYIENARNLKKHIKNLKFYKEYIDLSHKELLWDEDLVEIINGVLK